MQKSINFDQDKLAQDVKFFIDEHQVSHRQLSNKNSLSNSTISRFLRGDEERCLDFDHIVDLCKAIHEPIDAYINTNQDKIIYYEDATTFQKIKASIYADKDLSYENKVSLITLMRIAIVTFAT